MLGFTALVLIGVALLPQPKMPGAPSILYSKESPMDRMEWEQLRTCNPQTGEVPPNMKTRTRQFANTLPVRGQGGLAKSSATLDWTFMGPYNVGGRTRALGVDVRDRNIVLAAGVSGAMFRSTDGGTSWTNVTPPEALHNTTCLKQDTRPGHEDTWYYGTGEWIGNSADVAYGVFSGNGLFKSTDNGLTWEKLAPTATDEPQTSFLNDYIYTVAVNTAAQTDEVYYAMAGAIRRSTDGGQTWNWAWPSPLSSPYNLYTDIEITTTGVIYTTLSNNDGTRATSGIFRSEDGINFTDITPSAWPTTFRRTVLAIDPVDENTVYFLAHAPGYGLNDAMLWRFDYLSGDGSGAGGTWTDLSSNLPAFGSLTGDYDPQGGYNMLIKVNPHNNQQIFIGGTNLYRSDDAFATPDHIAWIGGYPNKDSYGNYPNQHADQHALIFMPDRPGTLVSGHDGGVSLTTVGDSENVTWASLNHGYNTTQFYTVAIASAKSGSRMIVGGMQDNGTYGVNTAGPTAHWEQVLSGDGCHCALSPDASVTYVSYQNGGTFRTTNSSWAEIDPEGARINQFINPYVMDPNNHNRIYMVGRDKIWRCDNTDAIPKYDQNPATTGWATIPGIASEVDTIITAIAVSKTPANRVYCTTKNGKVFRVDNATADAPTVTSIGAGKGLPSGGWVNSIAIHPDDADKVVLTFSNYEVQSLFYSTNGGSTWTSISGNLEQYEDGTGNGPSCRWAAFMPWNGTDWLFVGTSEGLYSTSNLNGGSTQWMREGAENIGNVVVDMVVTRPLDGWVVAATHGKGVWAATMGVTGVETDQAAPDGFALLPNFPNPFNPETTIPFKVEKTRQVKVEVYDLRGRLVETLSNDIYVAGEHRLTFNAEDLPSGTYLVRMSSGQSVKTQKISLLK